MGAGNSRVETHQSRLPAEVLTMQAEAADSRRCGTFQLGEVVELRGSRFRIMDIAGARVSLRLLPPADAQRP